MTKSLSKVIKIVWNENFIMQRAPLGNIKKSLDTTYSAPLLIITPMGVTQKKWVCSFNPLP